MTKPPSRRRKRAMNVSIPLELAEEARAYGTNVSAVLEKALNEEHREKRREAWQRQNREAIETWNTWVEDNGVPFEDLETVVNPHQFDVHQVIGLRDGSAVDLAIVLQDDALANLSTRVVAPLVPIDRLAPIDRMTPAVEVEDRPYMIAMHLVTTIPSRNLGARIASLRDQERAIKNALDLVFFGV